MNFKEFYEELKRRNVIKSALTYLVISWIITQVVTTVLPTFGAPEYIQKTFVFILILGFPLWVVFSWVYELTPTGLQKTKNVSSNQSITNQTNSRLNKILLLSLGIAIVLLSINLIQGNSIELQKNEISINTKDFGSNSIAVLAFADMSPDKDQEYFSDGISEEILNLLAKIPDLKVISRTSSFSYKGKDQDIKVIGEELQVRNVLEGSIRKAGNTFRITAQLIDTEDGTHVWSETYDRDIEDIFKIQDEIAATVTDKLKVTLLGEAKVASKKTNTEAYNMFLQAKAYINQGNKEKNEQGIKLLKNAIKIDPNFAQAWVLLSTGYSRSISNYGVRPMSYFDSVFIMAKQAIQLDPNSSEAVSNLAYSYLVDGDNINSRLYSEKALQLNKNDAKANNIYGLLLRNSGEVDKAIPYFEKVAQIDPVRVGVFNYNLGTCYQFLEMIPEGVHYYKKILESRGFSAITHQQLAECAVYTNDKEEVLHHIDELIKGDESNLLNLNRSGMYLSYFKDFEKANTYFEKVYNHPKFTHLDYAESAIGVAYQLIRKGETKKGNRILDETFKVTSDKFGFDTDFWEYCWNYARIEAIRGNTDAAIKHVERMIKGGFLMYRLANMDPYLKGVHDDPRFIKLMNNLESKVSKMRNKVIARNMELMKKN